MALNNLFHPIACCQDDEEEVDLEDSEDQDVSDDFDGETSHSLIDSETNSLSNSTGWRRGVTIRASWGGKTQAVAPSGQPEKRTLDVFKLWISLHFFLQLDFSVDFDPNGGKWT